MEGDESHDPLLGEQVYVPYTDGVYPGVVTSVVAGAGGRVWVEHTGEKEMFRVERHLLHASHTAAVAHWENQKAAKAASLSGPPKGGPWPGFHLHPGPGHGFGQVVWLRVWPRGALGHPPPWGRPEGQLWSRAEVPAQPEAWVQVWLAWGPAHPAGQRLVWG